MTNQQLDYTNQFGYPFGYISGILDLKKDRGKHYFDIREAAVEQISDFLVDFTGPNRKPGDLVYVWQSNLLAVYLFERDNRFDYAIVRVDAKYEEGRELIRDFARQLFQHLAQNFYITKHIPNGIDYIVEPLP